MLSVKEVYNKIASHFDVSRQRIWGSVRTFLNNVPPNSLVLDVGCGNGKNMLYRKDLVFVGIDNSSEQIKICTKKHLYALEADITNIPFATDTFDYMICIATYHHLDNDDVRQRALNEMSRCLKPGGQLLLTVWAMEQHEGSTFHFTQSDEMVPWTTTDGTTYLRYYHIYRKGELLAEICRLCDTLTVKADGWELGNWYVVLEKIR
jgi:SAM-dependent methyltransferase